MKFDLHTHHDRCGHASHKIEDYIQSAIERGLDVIGISDHSPYFMNQNDQPHPGTAMATSDFPNYVAEVLQLKQKYKADIEVLLGMESDYFPKLAQAYELEYAKYPFDYIIGSVHSVHNLSIFNRNRWKRLTNEQKTQLKEDYYQLIEQSAQSGYFQILGHIDAMKGYYPQFSDIETDVVEKTLKIIAASEVAVEVNTSGKTKDCGGWYPSHHILELAHHHQVEITFGSDAHHPERVGDDFDNVKQLLKDIGFTHWVFFRQRKKVKVAL